MGGRGSCYLNYNNPNNDDNQILSDLLDNADNDKDTLKEYNGKTQKLKDKNIHIKESTDHLPEDVFIPNIRKIDSLTRKYLDTSDILENKQEQLSIRSDKLKSGTVACFISDSTNFSSLQIVLNKDLTFANRERVEKMTSEQIDSGFWSTSDKNELVNHTLTHEFGHYVQKVIMEKEKETPKGKERYNKMSEALSNTNNINEKNLILQTYSEDCATRYFKEIQRIHRKKFGKENENDISRYARKSNSEAFAELFANLNTSKNPNKLSQAMLIFLEKNMTVKGKKID